MNQVLLKNFSLCTFLWLCLIGLGCTQKGKVGGEFEHLRQKVFSGEFGDASQGLRSFVERNPRHELCGRATFLLAKSRLGMGELDEAAQLFQQTIDRFPGSEEANKAEFKIASIRLMQEEHEQAIQILQHLAQEANGPYTPEAVAWLAYLQEKEPAP